MIDMQVTEAWIAIEISNDAVVTAYGPFDTNGEAMRFISTVQYDRETIVRKLRRPPSPHLWRGPQPARSLDISIDQVDGLSVRTVNMLQHAGMETLEQVSACTKRNLRRHGMTKASIREINEALVRVGLELKP
jgi:DNA-directed RNA polymerase alpha subunit